MQKIHIKLLSVFSAVLFTFLSYSSFAEDAGTKLKKADQLFLEKKYTESYNMYHKLFTEEKKFTPQTLLKMAFIKEALGENTEALYYLNVFYENFPEKRVFNKMKEIAAKQKLEGYVYSDLEFFSNLYRKKEKNNYKESQKDK